MYSLAVLLIYLLFGRTALTDHVNELDLFILLSCFIL